MTKRSNYAHFLINGNAAAQGIPNIQHRQMLVPPAEVSEKEMIIINNNDEY
jgi:hypothetical protein